MTMLYPNLYCKGVIKEKGHRYVCTDFVFFFMLRSR